jgi:hypothetical protein
VGWHRVRGLGGVEETASLLHHLGLDDDRTEEAAETVLGQRAVVHLCSVHLFRLQAFGCRVQGIMVSVSGFGFGFGFRV